MKPDALPSGLKIAVKAPDSDKKTLKDVMEIHETDSYYSLVENNQDNMLSLMKKSEGI